METEDEEGQVTPGKVLLGFILLHLTLLLLVVLFIRKDSMMPPKVKFIVDAVFWVTMTVLVWMLGYMVGYEGGKEDAEKEAKTQQEILVKTMMMTHEAVKQFPKPIF